MGLRMSLGVSVENGYGSVIRIFMFGDIRAGKEVDQIWPYPSHSIIHGPDLKSARITCYSQKRRGFKFVGHIIYYAFMQATGIVNNHLM
jgi:hypothetical protein